VSSSADAPAGSALANNDAVHRAKAPTMPCSFVAAERRPQQLTTVPRSFVAAERRPQQLTTVPRSFVAAERRPRRPGRPQDSS